MTDVIRIETADDVVTMPVDKKILGNFISGLLGQPQTLERQFQTAFSIDHAWLIHFCSLINQRISQQNSPEPLSFKANIYYENGVKRTVSSFAAFEHFAETQNIICKAVKISMSLLIQFSGKNIPEKQDLVFWFETSPNIEHYLGRFIGVAGKESTGIIDVEIRHTERTWADDMFRLILEEINSIAVSENRLKKWLRTKVFPLYSLIFPVVMLCMLGIGSWGKQKNADILKEKMDVLLKGNQFGLPELHEKMNVLLGYSYENNSQQFAGVAIFIGLCLGMGIIFYIGTQLVKPSPSFVVMSKATEKYRDETLKSLQKKNYIFIGTMILTVALGLTSNFLYDKIK